jgi:hypothetical protein
LAEAEVAAEVVELPAVAVGLTKPPATQPRKLSRSRPTPPRAAVMIWKMMIGRTSPLPVLRARWTRLRLYLT